MPKAKTPIPSIKDLLAALGQAEGQLRVTFDTLQRFNVGSDIDRRRLKGRWKKRTPKLGRAIIDMLGKEGQPDIFARLQVTTETLSGRDAIVDRLQAVQAALDGVSGIISDLLLTEKAAYYDETSGTVAAINTMLNSKLTNPEEKKHVRSVAHWVIAVANEIAAESVDSRKGNEKLKDTAVRAATAARSDPEATARDLEIKVLKGQQLRAEDVSQPAIPRRPRRTKR